MPRLEPTLGMLLCALAVSVAAHADVLVTTLDEEKPVRGISLTAGEDAVAVHSAGEGKVKRIDTSKVIEIATVPAPAAPPAATRPFELELVCGTRIRGKIVGPGAAVDTVRIESPVLKEAGLKVDVPLDVLYAVRRVDGPLSTRIVRLPDEDAAYRVPDARIQGTVNGFTATGVEIDRGELGMSAIGYAELAALFLVNEPLPRPDTLHVVARLADGSAILLTKGFRVDGGVLRGATPSGVRIRVHVNRVAALGFQGGSFLHLSDLAPKAVEREPFFPLPEGPAADAMLDFVCPVRMDASPDGSAIHLAKRRYFKGIGVRPTTRITYALDGRFETFVALCGIDDEVLGAGYGRGAGTGSVLFSVLVDGKEAWRSGRVEGGRKPVPVRVGVAGAKELTLVVSLVPRELMPKGIPDSPELDNAVWARPLLIR